MLDLSLEFNAETSFVLKGLARSRQINGTILFCLLEVGTWEVLFVIGCVDRGAGVKNGSECANTRVWQNKFP